MPGERGLERGVRLFTYLVDAANRGEAVGISYGSFLAFLHGASSFYDLTGRDYVRADNAYVLSAAQTVTARAGGRKRISRAGVAIEAGMDTFIWRSRAPFDRPPAAWQSSGFRIPYSREEWLLAFPDSIRKLKSISDLEDILGYHTRVPSGIPASASTVAVTPLAWNDFLMEGREAYTANNTERAYGYFETALVSAPRGALLTQEYLDALDEFVVVAKAAGKLLRVGPMVVDSLCGATQGNTSAPAAEAAKRVLQELTDAPTNTLSERGALADCLRHLAEIVANNGAIPAIASSLRLLLEKFWRPAIWDCRLDLFLLAYESVLGDMFPIDELGGWCLRVCGISRQREVPVSESQTWLQRAAKFGMAKTPEYIAEQKTLTDLLSVDAADRLPEPAKKPDPPDDILGASEPGHFEGDRMVRWARRLQRSYPWVASVRRVRADPNLDLYPTRILDLSALTRHIKTIAGVDPVRIIPAVLDASYAQPANTRVVRINIVLSYGTTADQRNAAIKCLQRDTHLFPAK